MKYATPFYQFCTSDDNFVFYFSFLWTRNKLFQRINTLKSTILFRQREIHISVHSLIKVFTILLLYTWVDFEIFRAVDNAHAHMHVVCTSGIEWTSKLFWETAKTNQSKYVLQWLDIQSENFLCNFWLFAYLFIFNLVDYLSESWSGGTYHMSSRWMLSHSFQSMWIYVPSQV